MEDSDFYKFFEYFDAAEDGYFVVTEVDVFDLCQIDDLIGEFWDEIMAEVDELEGVDLRDELNFCNFIMR